MCSRTPNTKTPLHFALEVMFLQVHLFLIFIFLVNFVIVIKSLRLHAKEKEEKHTKSSQSQCLKKYHFTESNYKKPRRYFSNTVCSPRCMMRFADCHVSKMTLRGISFFPRCISYMDAALTAKNHFCRLDSRSENPHTSEKIEKKDLLAQIFICGLRNA